MVKSGATRKMAGYPKLFFLGMVSGPLMILMGLLTVFLFDLLIQVIIKSKLPLTPDSDVTRAWIQPPIKPLLKIYYFNVTNPEEYLQGENVPIVAQVGPYTYQEKWVREDVEWDEDEEKVGFRMKKTYFFREDLTNGSLDDVVTTPNVPMFASINKMRALGPEYLLGITTFLDLQEDPPQNVFEQRTVREITWGHQHALVDLANSILPEEEKLPELYGYFFGKNNSLEDPLLVDTGTNDILSVGKVVKQSNQTKLNIWESGKENSCNAIEGTDGSVFPPFLTKDSRPAIFTKDMCRSLELEFSKTVDHSGLQTLRFIPSGEAFSAKDHPCFCPGEAPCAPEGLFNVTECHKAPMFLSWPHFYKADPNLRHQVGGLEPKEELHEFHVDILPELGVGLRAAIRLQINLHIRVEGVSKLKNATDVYLPIIWFSDGVEELDDPETLDLLRSAVITPRRIRMALSVLLLLLGIAVLITCIVFLLLKRRRKELDIASTELNDYKSGKNEAFQADS